MNTIFIAVTFFRAKYEKLIDNQGNMTMNSEMYVRHFFLYVRHEKYPRIHILKIFKDIPYLN